MVSLAHQFIVILYLALFVFVLCILCFATNRPPTVTFPHSSLTTNIYHNYMCCGCCNQKLLLLKHINQLLKIKRNAKQKMQFLLLKSKIGGAVGLSFYLAAIHSGRHTQGTNDDPSIQPSIFCEQANARHS